MKFNYYIAILSVVIATLCVVPTQQQAQQSSKCLDDFRELLMSCVKEANIQMGNFLWFTTNGTSQRSEAPASPDTFKSQICGAQNQITGCTFQKLGPIMNSSACVGTSQSTSQQGQVGAQLQTIFGTYDLKCMHPCRATLPVDLRACYTDNKLDANLFISNTTNGAVIGKTQEQATAFCGVKENLVKCMQDKANACPEAPQILRALDLDIPSFQKGVTVLCNHQDVYLHGLKCFTESTPDVDRCRQKETQDLMQLDQNARAGNWSESRFYQEFCPISVRQIDCDLTAWSKKNHEACNEAVIGLRRELECELIPNQCNVEPKQIEQNDHACHPEKFSSQARNNYGKGTASIAAVINTCLILASLGMATLL